jgi:small subunit ribosomal protein S6
MLLAAMATAAPVYDLVLLLDPAASDEQRTKILSDARGAIGAEQLVADNDWGTRPLAYQIDRREAAEYHLLQFRGTPELISSLQHSLRIADGVVRHRIIKLPPAHPEPTPA